MSSFEACSDEELVELVRGGNELAEEAIIERYKNMVRIKSRSYFLMGADREDLIQEGMIGLFKAVRDYSAGHEMSFRSFSDMCVQRQLISAIKRAARKKHSPLNTYVSFYRNENDDGERALIDTIAAARTENPEDTVISRESYDGVAIMLNDMLSPLEKQVLDLFLSGRSYQQISQALGRSSKCVDNALQRIKKKLELYRESIAAD